MLIPIRTDYHRHRKPWVNYALVATNIFLFVWLYLIKAGSDASVYNGIIRDWMLSPTSPQLVQFISSIFLHADWAHLIGNMIFLWVFGNAINDKFGHFGYLAFYLAGGIIASIGYLGLGGVSFVLGASGAIAAVTGAYLVLLPRTSITVIIFAVYFIFPLEISSLIFIAFQIAFNFYWTFADSGSNVAHSAHTSGYVFGIVISILVLKLKLIRRDDWDILHLYLQYKRRRQYRQAVANGYDPFSVNSDSSRARKVASTIFKQTQPADPETLAVRKAIAAACREKDFVIAAKLYVQLQETSNTEQVLAEQNQLDVSNQFMMSQDYLHAASGYATFLKYYPRSPFCPDIELMLGRIYSRYYPNKDLAKIHLQKAIETQRDISNRKLAQEELDQLEK